MLGWSWMVSVIKVMGLGINGTLPDIVGNVRLTVLEVEVHSDQGRSQFGSQNKLYAWIWIIVWVKTVLFVVLIFRLIRSEGYVETSCCEFLSYICLGWLFIFNLVGNGSSVLLIKALNIYIRVVTRRTWRFDFKIIFIQLAYSCRFVSQSWTVLVYKRNKFELISLNSSDSCKSPNDAKWEKDFFEHD